MEKEMNMDMGGWDMGFGWMGWLFWVVVLLLAAALVKYLFSGTGK